MRVGIDIQAVANGNRSGLYNHLRYLAFHLRPLLKGQLWLLADASYSSITPAAAAATCRAMDGESVIWLRQPWRLCKVWRRLYKVWHWASRVDRLDFLLHNLHGRLPLCTRGANGYVVPDVIPLAFDYQLPGFAEGYRPYYEAAVKNGDIIIVWSEHTKQDLLNRIGGTADRVHVIPLAAGSIFHPIEDCTALRQALAFYKLAEVPYVLCVSTIEARKNHAVLLHAFARIVARDHALPHRLVLVGGKWVGHEAVFDLVTNLGLSDRVSYLGFAESLPMLYAGAEVFVFPSLYEGFGLPPLEAMACGTPVLSSNASSLPEVISDAGVLFSPHDVDTLAEQLYRVLTDRAYHADLAQRGLKRAAQFTWGRTAQLYHAAFCEALKNRTQRLASCLR